MLVGVISDTHGLLRPEALRALRGCEHIVHAGDVGTPEVLAALRALAPVTAVRGNNDRGAWAEELAARERVQLGAAALYVLHDLGELELDPAAARVDVIISGHSHRARNEVVEGVLYLNPGSAGPRRFRLPVTLARLRIGRGVKAKIVPLL